MVVTFEEDYLESLYTKGETGVKKYRFQPQVRANDQYRVEFTLEETDDKPVVTICNIKELSNHYK